MIRVDKNEAREKYSYFAYPKKLDRTLSTMITEEAGKYGIENVKDLMRNILMEAVVYYEKKHRYVEARDWAAANWQKARFTDTTATNIDEKMKSDEQKEKEEMQKLLDQITKMTDRLDQIKKNRDERNNK